MLHGGAYFVRVSPSETLKNRATILQKLKNQIARGIPIIGAGAGTGISAKFEEEGGADLIVIYNSGRFRMAGRGSLAGLMPYKDANAVVLDMASEVLPVCTHLVILVSDFIDLFLVGFYCLTGFRLELWV